MTGTPTGPPDVAPAARLEVDAGDRGVADGLLFDLADALRRVENGDLVALATSDDEAVADALDAWSRLTGHPVVARTAAGSGRVRHVIRKGAAPGSDDDRELGHRLWIYANFDCNLACDYCCVRSSPTAPRRAIGPDRARRLAAEAKDLGFRRVFLTGGEPFLLPDVEEIVSACAEHLPTTVLTNATLFKGAKLGALDRLPRDRVTLQVSLDSPEPGRHDAHRGEGTWARAREGVRVARDLGFRVRIAATTSTEAQRAEMHAFLAAEGVPEEDRIVRPVALRGHATEGLALARVDLVPELTATATGIYWHPVGATDDDLLVTRDLFPLSKALREARRLVAEDRAFAARVAEVFRCA